MLKVKSRSGCKDKHKVAETHKTKIHKTQSSYATMTKEEKKKKPNYPIKKKKGCCSMEKERHWQKYLMSFCFTL